MLIKSFIEQLTDQRSPYNISTFSQFQHSLYVKVLKKERKVTGFTYDRFGKFLSYCEKTRPAVIIITNTPF